MCIHGVQVYNFKKFLYEKTLFNNYYKKLSSAQKYNLFIMLFIINVHYRFMKYLFYNKYL